ncbi:hypothetical protein D7B24_003897 [Verticillium nonalfalfae]|uniref:Pectinesterase n=1 Tax=Verticillium nonalfalfae TaxID=1051616 RepID=A0A3M9XWN0_9PEZI|nr:uncharacterized protein D7B24_003897 [Verticillium nonalfalfae]RNJ52295.1 hypothetical protein D7B24_003897 [Verticillium nonalfalfae]
MHFIRLFLLGTGLGVSALSCVKSPSRTKPPPGAIVVDASKQYPDSYPTVGQAIAAIENTTAEHVVFLMPGVYSEQVYIPSLSGPLKLQGYTKDSRSYFNNEVTITGNLSRQTPGLTNNDQTSTVRLWTSDVKVYNLNIANTFGQAATGGQALALSAQRTNEGFYGCSFTGFQDTIYANEGRQIYANSYINGAVDFVFGLRASAWFENCDIETIGPGFITANGRESEENKSFYVFNHANITGTSGEGSTVLGRPWRPFSRVVFQNSWLGNVVKAAGWSAWDATQSVANIFYREYGNTGPGAVGPRVEFAGSLDAPVQPVTVLGHGFETEWWVDTTYL